MDLCYTARLAIAFMWTLCVTRYSLANDELENVKSWMPRPHKDRKIMEMVEQQLLKLFGFKRKANPRETLHVPEHMWTMYRKWSGELHDDTDKLSNVVRVIHHDGELRLPYLQIKLLTSPFNSICYTRHIWSSRLFSCSFERLVKVSTQS